MEIINIKPEHHVKIGKTSITVRNEDGKTCGIVRNINTWDTLQLNRQYDYSGQLRASGIWGNKLNLLHNVVFDGKEVYLFVNRRTIENAEKYNQEDIAKTYVELFQNCNKSGVNVIIRYMD